MVGLASSDRAGAVSRWWIPFFVLASFLFAVNPATGVFHVYLHNDPLAILAMAIGFWLLVQYAATASQRWLWAMALMPTAGFLVKQYLLILVACYLTYLVFAGRDPLRRVIIFGAVSVGLLAVTVGLCSALWGQAFVYWVVQVMGGHTISLTRVLIQFVNAAVFLLPGVVGGWYLLHRSLEPRLLGLWTGWMVMVVGAAYTSGITFHPSHYGPAVIVGACFFLAALARVWPKADDAADVPGRALLQSGIGFVAVLMLFGSFRLIYAERKPLSPDLFRYTAQVEAEFDGLPAESVLLDLGEWVYLQRGVVMTDRNAIFLTHRTIHEDLKQRVRQQRFSRILVHNHAPELYSYDAGNIHKGIREEMLRFYREVRHIPAVRGMESWQYHNMMLSEISVLEPIPQPGMQTPVSRSSRRREEP